MRFFHLSDLHIGRQLHYYSLEREQRAVLGQIIEQARRLQPDAILIAGDIYDRVVPSAEACTLLDDFFRGLSQLTPRIPVLVIAGNHDNARRLSYASSFLRKNGIYVSAMPPATQEERLEQVTLTDAFGSVHFYLLPFTKPGYVRALFAEGAVTDYDSAIRLLIEREQINTKERNVLVSHQFYVSGAQKPQTCESETGYLAVGGLDAVDVSALEPFDYAALGHIHGAQQVGNPRFYYCGTPLKYSVSECAHEKGITVVTLGKKGEPPQLMRIPLAPLFDVRKIRGTLQELLDAAKEPECHDYISATVTDEQELYHPKEKLEEVYDHLLELRIDNSRTRAALSPVAQTQKTLEPFRAFCDFFRELQGRELDSREADAIKQLIAEEEV